MTKEEAIGQLEERLDLIKRIYNGCDVEDYAEALEMAIEALRQFAEDSKKVSAEGQDSISRQMAISHVDDVPYIKEHPNVGLLWKAWIESLPAAQPKRTQERTETHSCDLISRQAAIDAVRHAWAKGLEPTQFLEELPSAQPDVPDTNVGDMISKKAVLRGLTDIAYNPCKTEGQAQVIDYAKTMVCVMPSAQIEQRYTEEELRVFQHGISLSLLSKKSAQHWRYDEDTATEIKFLERLYEKVGADMRGEQDG